MISKMNNLIVRTITGALFVAAVVCSFLNAAAMLLLFAIVTGLSIWEYTGLVNEQENVNTNRFISTVAGVYFFFAVAGFCSELTPTAVFIPYLITVIYLIIAELFAKNPQPVDTWAYTMLSQMWIALPLSTINILAFPAANGEPAFSCVLPLCVFVFLWLNDAGAYCCGSLLGKHKLFPRISPKKSWEGSIGGAVLVFIAAALIGYLLGNYEQTKNILTIPQWMGMGLVVVVFGTFGDLVESLFKRTLGIKDSGNILPGHGGMLDRFDSTLMAFPAVVIYLYTLSLL
ncbi:MAG: phosphatidate cytidylyltransferase [Prevotellaceae bacterium]|nr:phosphatidate cytidylyltransferase [Prevotellaceae bacterium]